MGNITAYYFVRNLDVFVVLRGGESRIDYGLVSEVAALFQPTVLGWASVGGRGRFGGGGEMRSMASLLLG